MLKLPKELLLIKKDIKKWINKKKIIDVILFGSIIRGKEKPRDIDLCIIINEKDESKSLDLINSLSRITDKNKRFKFQINLLTEKQFINGNTLTNTLIKEGFSIKKGKKLAEIWEFESKSLFIYSLKKFSNTKRVKFHYVLKGRYGQKGILGELKGEFLGTGSIIITSENEDKLKEVFDKWDVDYKVKNVLIS